MGQACTRQQVLGPSRRGDVAEAAASPETDSVCDATQGASPGARQGQARSQSGPCRASEREEARRFASSPGGAPSRLLEGEKCMYTRKKWKPASPSLVYCLINNLADRHLAVVFDCREREKYEANHLHYAVCPWRNAQDVAAVLEYFEKHGAPLVANADILKKPKGLSPPASKSAAANPAARSPRFVFPAFLSRTQTLTSSANGAAAEKRQAGKGAGDKTPPSPLVFTPEGGASESTAPSLVVVGMTSGQLDREEARKAEEANEARSGGDAQTEMGGEKSAATPEETIEEGHKLEAETLKPDRATVAAAAMKRARSARSATLQEGPGTLVPASQFPQQTDEEDEQKAEEETEPRAAEATPEGDEPRRLVALKAWLRTVCKFRTVIMYGEGDDDALLLMFLNSLLDSGARFKAAIVLAGGISSLGSRYSPLLITSDLLLPGPVELIPPFQSVPSPSPLSQHAGAASACRRTASNLQEFQDIAARGSVKRLPSTRRVLGRTKTVETAAAFSVFVACTPSLIHENEEILRHFGIKMVINLTPTACPLPVAPIPQAAPASSPSRVRRLLSASPKLLGGFEVHNMPFTDVASFPFEDAAALLRHAKESNVAVLVYDYRGENTVAPGIMNPALVSELHRHAETLAKVPSSGASSASQPAAAASARKAKNFAFHVLPFGPSRKGDAPGDEGTPETKERETEQEKHEAKEAPTPTQSFGNGPANQTTPEAPSPHPPVRPAASLHTLGSLYTDASPVSPLPVLREQPQEELTSHAPLEETVSCALASWRETVSAEEAERSIATLRKILSNILQHPTDEKFRRLKLTNKRFHESVGSHPELVKILLLAGFVLHPGEAVEFPSDAPLHKLSDLLALLPPASLNTAFGGTGREQDSSLLSTGNLSTSVRSLAPSSALQTPEVGRDTGSSLSSVPHAVASPAGRAASTGATDAQT
uniref:PUB domain-containing protein n=1 Tax=Neospora caninum (strain Liverpool) TaxID=572307 RepID=A0A0F7UHK2_NEOCL|nr:TPA: PUB domain-containing protein [Neospora caninum Liverpool]